MFCDSNFAASCVRLEPGEMLVLFTDGVTEANDHTGEEFGMARLFDSINGSLAGGPQELLQNCLAAITSFRKGAVRNDDLTMMALKYAGKEN